MKIRIVIALSLLCVSFSASAARRGGIQYDGWHTLADCNAATPGGCGATPGALTNTSAGLLMDGYTLNFGVNPTLPSTCSGCASILAAFVPQPPTFMSPPAPNQYWITWGSPLQEEIYVTPVSSSEFTVSFAFDPNLDTGYKTELDSFSFSGHGGSGSFSAVDLYDSPQIAGTSPTLNATIDFDIKNGQVVGMSSGWQAVAAPEIDLGTAVSELTLLAGCLFVLGGRRKLSAIRGR